MTTQIILDCDPGHDDAIALLLAYGSPSIELLAVTTVAGNQTLEKVSQNARSIAQIAGIVDVPFAAGCDRPLVRPLQVASAVHGESGLDGPVLPAPDIPLSSTHAVDLIIETVMSRPPQSVTLVPTGALTNIALAARKEPRIVPRVREVVLMGGGFHGGNWSATSEFNIAIDPEAAHIVFNENWSVTMVGLDVTHKALAIPEILDRIREVGTRPAAFVLELLDYFTTAYAESQGFAHPPVHDPVAVARVIDPSIVPVVRVPIDIELSGNHTLGMTVADFRSSPDDNCTTFAATDLDHGRFWALVVDALQAIGEPAAYATHRPDSSSVRPAPEEFALEHEE